MSIADLEAERRLAEKSRQIASLYDELATAEAVYLQFRVDHAERLTKVLKVLKLARAELKLHDADHHHRTAASFYADIDVALETKP